MVALIPIGEMNIRSATHGWGEREPDVTMAFAITEEKFGGFSNDDIDHQSG